jgi:glycosyltransferase involved in cell wall biosynthesis
MACGTPVVAAGGGGARELVAASGAGLTFRAGDAGALAAAAVALLSQPAGARRALGARGRAHVLGALTWRAVMGRIHDTYRRLGATPAGERAAA